MSDVDAVPHGVPVAAQVRLFVEVYPVDFAAHQFRVQIPHPGRSSGWVRSVTLNVVTRSSTSS